MHMNPGGAHENFFNGTDHLGIDDSFLSGSGQNFQLCRYMTWSEILHARPSATACVGLCSKIPQHADIEQSVHIQLLKSHFVRLQAAKLLVPQHILQDMRTTAPCFNAAQHLPLPARVGSLPL